MKQIVFLSCLFFALTATAQRPSVAPTRPVVDEYINKKFTDLYRWMEKRPNPEPEQRTGKPD